MTNLEQLRIFIAAAETGSFSAAGRILKKGQSAISISIANLETDLGFDLFDRSFRKPVLTNNGKRLLAYAHSVLLQVEDFDIAAKNIFSGHETSIKIVVDDAIFLPALSRVLVEFGNKFPATQVEFFSAVSPEIPEFIEQGKADIGLMFTGGVVQNGVEQVHIGNLPFVSVSSPDYPLAKLDTIGSNQLLPHRQLLLRSSRGSVLEHFPSMSTEVWTAASFHNIRELVIHGVGWAYLPKHLVDSEIQSGSLARLKLRFEHSNWSPSVECVIPKHITMGPAFSWLWHHIKNVLSPKTI